MYIGRTHAYYEDEDDSVFTPEYWTYSSDPDDGNFAGEVHELTLEGESELNWWLECRRMNEWQRNHSFGVRSESPAQMWNILTDPEFGYSKPLL